MTTRVMERLVGTEDGHNLNFTLSRKSANSSPFHLFLNGLELSPGTDYGLSEGNMGVHLNVAPKKEDILRANYETASAPPSSSRGTPIKTNRLATFTRQALLESVYKEQVGPSTTQTVQPARAMQVQPAPSAVPKQGKENRSLSMLERRMSEKLLPSPTSKPNVSREQTSFEGTGDRPVISPYAALLKMNPAGRSFFDSNDGSERDVRRSTPRSIQMLKRVLDSNDGEENRQMKKGKR